MTLGENIVRLRTKENLSQSDLADMLDVSRQSISKWETDTSILLVLLSLNKKSIL